METKNLDFGFISFLLASIVALTQDCIERIFKRRALAESIAEVNNRDKIIAQLESQMAARDEKAAQKEIELEAANKRIAELENSIREKTQLLEEAQEHEKHLQTIRPAFGLYLRKFIDLEPDRGDERKRLEERHEAAVEKAEPIRRQFERDSGKKKYLSDVQVYREFLRTENRNRGNVNFVDQLDIYNTFYEDFCEEWKITKLGSVAFGQQMVRSYLKGLAIGLVCHYKNNGVWQDHYLGIVLNQEGLSEQQRILQKRQL